MSNPSGLPPPTHHPFDTIYPLLFALDDNTHDKNLNDLSAALKKNTYIEQLINSTTDNISFAKAIEDKITEVTPKINELYVKHTIDGKEYTFLMSDVLINLYNRRKDLSKKYTADTYGINVYKKVGYFVKNTRMMMILKGYTVNDTNTDDVFAIKITNNDEIVVDFNKMVKNRNADLKDAHNQARSVKKMAENAAADRVTAAKNRNMDKESGITHTIKNYFIPSSKSKPDETLAINSQGKKLWNTAIVSHMPNQSVYSTMDSVDVTLHNLFKQINDETTSSYTADGDDTQRNKYTNEANKSNEEEKNVKGVKVHTTFVVGEKKVGDNEVDNEVGEKKENKGDDTNVGTIGGKKHKRTRRKNIKSKRKYTRRKTIKGGAPIKKTKGTKNIRRKISYKNKTRRYKN
jgi:hypothetical protein